MSAETLVDLYHAHTGKVSDKWSSYLPVYEEAFAALRDRKVSLLEIGIQNGGSLEIYSRYFPHPERLVGCDINPDCGKLKYEDPRIQVIVGDANSPEIEKQILAVSGSFDIILDDGSHTSTDIVRTFARYWRHLRAGGIYLAEDLHCSYWQEYGGGLHDPLSSISFFKALADILNHEHWGLSGEARKRLENFAQFYGVEFRDHELEEVHAVEFFNSVCLVRKEPAPRNSLGRRILAGQQAAVVPHDPSLMNSAPPRPDQTANEKAADPLCLPETHLQLYWGEDGNFSEQQSANRPYLCGERQIVSLPLPVGRGSQLALRLDPADRPGLITLGSVRLQGRKADGLPWIRTLEAAEIFPAGDLLALPEPAGAFLATGCDPQLHLVPVMLEEGTRGNLEVEIGFRPEAAALAPPLRHLSRTVVQQADAVNQLAGAISMVQEAQRQTGVSIRESVERSIGEVKIELAQQIKAQKEAEFRGREAVERSIGEVRGELAAQRESVAGWIRELGEQMEERARREEERRERERAEGEARLASIQAAIEGKAREQAEAQRQAEAKLTDLGDYLGKVQDMASSPWLNYVPAPFSWPILLFKARSIMRPQWFPRQAQAPKEKKPGFWRRLERSIRKRRKKIQLAWSWIWFQRKWYLKNNLDVEKAGCDPWKHYSEHGWLEGRSGNRWSLLLKKIYHEGIERARIKCHSQLIRLCQLAGFKPAFIRQATLRAFSKWKGSVSKVPAYSLWLEVQALLEKESVDDLRRTLEKESVIPKISILLPVYNPDPRFLEKAILSVVRQSYPHWELCVADDASTDPRIRKIIESYARRDERIKVMFRQENGHISRASNSALDLATGEFVALLDHDDELSRDALLWVANEIREHPDAHLIYSDEDKIDWFGRRFQPYFKPDFNPTLFWSQNLITHLAVLRTALVKKLGGFRVGFEGSQDYDLFLRVVENSSKEQIRHIPKILYHWRSHLQSTASGIGQKNYALDASVKAVNEALHRQKIPARVAPDARIGCHRFQILFPGEKPSCSVLIPTRNAGELVRTCVESLFRLTEYPDFEVILADNGSDDPASLLAFTRLREKHGKRFQILPCPGPFNFSRINNQAARTASGSLLCLLNNDTEIVDGTWMEEMAWFAQRPEYGAVGAKLLYPDGRIQHAGVVLGIGGVAGHAFAGEPGETCGYFNRAILPSEFSAVTAACMMVERKKFLEVGGLEEEHLQVAFNDTDFCLKLREKGYRNVFNPRAVLLHHESKSRGYENNPEKIARFQKEQDYMKETWMENLQSDPAYNPNLTMVSHNFEQLSLAEILQKFKPKNSDSYQKQIA